MARNDIRQVKTSGSKRNESALTRVMNNVFDFVRFAEFEIFFILLFLIAFFFFKNLTSRPEYNQILVKKPEGDDFLPF